MAESAIGRTIILEKQTERKGTTLFFTNCHSITFDGKHLPELEKPNWHYYQTDDGYMIHCRKEHMVCVIEKL